MISKSEAAVRMAEPFPIAPCTTDPVEVAYEKVLAGVGAILPSRDAVDARLVEQVRTGTGRIIDSQRDAGGWPALAPGTAPVDTDGDGMPDEWERRFAFNPADPADGPADANGNGYTNVEEFLHGTNPR